MQIAYSSLYYCRLFLLNFSTREGVKMKIKYKFANGEISYVEVSDEVGAEILKSRRIEENRDRKERYHCYSLDGIDFEGDEFAEKDTPESLLLNKEEESLINEFMETLTDVQKRRLKMRIEGMSLTDILRILYRL